MWRGLRVPLPRHRIGPRVNGCGRAVVCVRLGAYGVYLSCQVAFVYSEKVLSHFGNGYSLRCELFCSH